MLTTGTGARKLRKVTGRVLVPLGCSSDISQTGKPINNRNLILIVLGAESPRSRCQKGRVRALFLGQSQCLLAEPSMVEGARELSGAYFFQALMLSMRALTSGLKHFPKAPPTNTITFGD